jgi:hypothetical protein
MTFRHSFVGTLRALALPAVAAALLGACAAPGQSGPVASIAPQVASKPQIPVLVPTTPPPDLGSVERFAWQQVVLLGDSFADGDIDGFLSRVSRGFYRNFSTLESSLRELLGSARARTAVVAVRQVLEEDGKVSVKAEWTRSVTAADGSVEARFGTTVFLFLKSDTSLRLLDYRGDPPFAISGI